MTIKLIGFDLDDCLFDSTGLSKNARIKGIDAMIDLGLKIERERAIEIIMEIVNEYGSNFSYHYNYFIRRLNQMDEDFNISFNMKYKYIAAAVMAYHKEKIERIELYDDVEEVLVKLNEMNIKKAIITDGIPIKQYEKIIRLNIDKLIDLVVISDQLGIRKPNPKLFEFFLKKFGVEGPETIYVGDRLDKDIIPALKNNIYSVYIHRGGKYDTFASDVPKYNLTPNFEIDNLNELFPIIEKINKGRYQK